MSLLPLIFTTYPTQSLKPSKIQTRSINNNNNNNNSVIIKKETKPLDNASGLAILNFIYEKKNGKLLKESSNNIDKLMDLLSIKTESNIKNITKKILMDNQVTVRDLIKKCKVSMTDLKLADIITTFKDLKDLKFNPSDLVIDRTLFDVNKMDILFKTYYKSSKNKDGITMTVVDLLENKFTSFELRTLRFPLDDFIENGKINSKQLLQLNYQLEELESIGFTKAHLKKLNITQKDAIDNFKWSKKQFDQL